MVTLCLVPRKLMQDVPPPSKSAGAGGQSLPHPPTRRPRADLVSLIVLVRFKQPVEKQTACWLIDPIPWLTARGGNLGSTEQGFQRQPLSQTPATELGDQDPAKARAPCPQLDAAPLSLLGLHFTSELQFGIQMLSDITC